MGEEPQYAYLIHARPFRDTSLTIELLTPGHGRVGAVARGARAARSRLRGVLQPFQPLWVTWKGRGELPTLTRAEPAGVPRLLGGRRLLSGLYVNELLLYLLPRQDSHPELFEEYRQVLEALAGPMAEEMALRRFEQRLLEELGYGLVLDCEAESGRPLEPELTYAVDVAEGVRPAVPGLPTVFPGRVLLEIQAGRFEERAVLNAAKIIMREALARALGGRRLKSRDLFRMQIRSVGMK